MKRISTEVRRAIRTDHQSGADSVDIAMKFGISRSSVYKIVKEIDRTDYQESVTVYDCIRKICDRKHELEEEVNAAKVRLEYAQDAYNQFIDQMREVFEGGQENGS